ncbi:MAG: zinc-dependent metalloprotease [Actinomycetaceae bacterium]|nr:zinc-dependent metalloprotease [Actinomycetaceae bacterium]
MSENESSGWEELLRNLLGAEAAEEMIRAMRAQGIDPTTMVGQSLPSNPVAMQSMMRQMRYLMDSNEGPINWRIAHDIAHQKAWGEADPKISSSEGQRIRQALQVADLWLDAATELDPSPGNRHAWRRTDWLDETLDVWKLMVEPVAINAARALSETLTEQMNDMSNAGIGDLPPGLEQLLGQAQPMMEKMSAVVFGSQIGQALGALALEAYGSTDVGLPLGKDSMTALVAPNIDSFADGFDIPAEEVNQFLALRETAHARLFHAVPWLRPEMLGAIQSYSAEIRINTDAMRDAAAGIDPMDTDALQNALSGQIFGSDPTPSQEKALNRLETLLALVEGWVDTVTHNAGRAYLPHLEQMREIMRRRRINGGPAEQMLATLIGLQLRPRQARNAARLWQVVGAERGVAERDALWSHPDLAPTSDELASPDDFLNNRDQRAQEEADIDAALDQMLDGTLGWAEGLHPGQDSEGDAQSDVD